MLNDVCLHMLTDTFSSSKERSKRHNVTTGGETNSEDIESALDQLMSDNFVVKGGQSEPSHPPANKSPFLSIGTTKLIDDGNTTGRPTLQRRRSSRSSSLSLTSIGENEELCASDEDNEEQMSLVASSATSVADTEGFSGRFAPSLSTFGRRRSASTITKSSSAPSLFLRRHSSSSILDLSSSSSVRTIGSTTNNDMNKRNFLARCREIDKVGPTTKLSSRKFERRLSESDDFIRVEERASRYNDLKKKKEMTRRKSLSLDDSNDQRIDTSVMGRRGTSHFSSSPSSLNPAQDATSSLNQALTRRFSMPISITEPDDDSVLKGLEDIGMLNIQRAGVGPSGIYHNRRSSM